MWDMWNNNVFLAEGIGMLIFAFILSFILYFNKTKTIKMNPYGEIVVTSFMISTALVIGIAVTLGLGGAIGSSQTGFDNPAAALIDAFGHQDYSIFLPAITGQISGVIIGFLLGSIIVGLASKDLKTAIQISKLDKEVISWRKSIFGELLSCVIFFSTMVFAVFSNNNVGIVIVGLGLFLALIVGGDRHALMLNAAIGIGTFLIGAFANFTKSSFANFIMKLSVNISLPILMGAVVFLV